MTFYSKFVNGKCHKFQLTSYIALYSYLVRQKVEEIINKKLVFPNKITKRFAKSIEAAELRSIEAEVRVILQ